MRQFSEKKIFYRQLSALLASGFAIKEALGQLSSSKSGIPAEAIVFLKSCVSGGEPLSKAMSLFGDNYFSLFETGVVEAGEYSGTLAESIGKLAENFEFLSAFKSKIVSGMVYPVILLHLAVLIPAAPFLFSSGPGAFLARIVPFFIFLYAIVFGCVFFYRYSNRYPSIAEKRDRLFLSLPYAGKLLYKVEVIRFLQAFIALYGAGAEIVRSFELAGNTTGNLCVRRELKALVPLLRRGEKLSEVLATRPWMPSAVIDMLKTGESTGRVDETLERVTSYLKQEADFAVEQIAKLAPVGFYLLVAAYVAYVIISFFISYVRFIETLF